MAQNHRGDGIGVEVGVSVAVAATSVFVGVAVDVEEALAVITGVVEFPWEGATGVPQAVNRTVMMNKDVKLVRILFPFMGATSIYDKRFINNHISPSQYTIHNLENC